MADEDLDNELTPELVTEEEGPPVKAVEDWATEKGFLPDKLPGGDGPPRPNPNYWKYSGARASCGWVERQLVTEEDFDRAIETQAAHIIR